jgi:hypothetical protein
MAAPGQSAGAAQGQPAGTRPAPAPAPTPAPPAAGQPQPISASPLAKELFSVGNLQTIGVSAGIGLLAAIVISIFPAIAFGSLGIKSLFNYNGYTLGSLLGGLTSFVRGNIIMPGNGMNFFHYLLLALAMGLSGGLHSSTVGTSSSNNIDATNLVSYPLGLTGVALFIGAAFGAFMLARKHSTHFKYTGLISGLITGLLPATAITLLCAIAAAPVASDNTITAHLTGATLRTFAMAYLLTTLGSLAGYALAQYASDSKTVFGAAWQWAHRTRGFVRTAVDTLFFQIILLFIAGLVALFAVTFASGQGLVLMTFPTTLLYTGGILFTWATFGSISQTYSGQLPSNGNLFNNSIGDPIWPIWVMFALFLILTLLTALRASARNLYDRAYMGWQHCWKAPVFMMVFWLIADLLLGTNGYKYTITSSTTLGPAMWCFLIMGIWAALVEVISLTFGPTLMVSMPFLWPILVGGTVRATPQPVVDYIHSTGAMFGRWPTWGAPSAGIPTNAGPKSHSPRNQNHPQNPYNPQNSQTPNPTPNPQNPRPTQTPYYPQSQQTPYSNQIPQIQGPVSNSQNPYPQQPPYAA